MTSTSEVSNEHPCTTLKNLAPAQDSNERVPGLDLTDGAQYSLSHKTEIDRLPPEILAAIFVHLSEPYLSEVEQSRSVQDLVSVTHVCRFWRQVAINASVLWSEISMANQEAVKTFLERSRTVPLNVDVRPVHRNVFPWVVRHTHRFRRLSVWASQEFDPFASLTKPAPLLERLDITCSDDLRPLILFDDQAPRLRELKIFASNLWFKNQPGNLTSLYLTLYDGTRPHSEFPPFFDMLHRCPALEEMFLWWNMCDVVSTELTQPHTVPLYNLRKLRLHSFCIPNVKYLLHSFDFMADGIAIHLSDVDLESEGEHFISRIQTVFPNNNPRQPSLFSSTKFELISHSQPPGIILHAIGPRFSIRIDTHLDDYHPPNQMNFTPHDVFSSAKELWIRGPVPFVAELNGSGHFPALEKLVFDGRGSSLAGKIRRALSPDGSGNLPSPLLSAIDYYGDDEWEVDEIILLARSRYSVGHQLKMLRVPSSFVLLIFDVGGCVQDVGSLDIPSEAVHMYSMDLPDHCFAKGHEWWESWQPELTNTEVF